MEVEVVVENVQKIQEAEIENLKLIGNNIDKLIEETKKEIKSQNANIEENKVLDTSKIEKSLVVQSIEKVPETDKTQHTVEDPNVEEIQDSKNESIEMAPKELPLIQETEKMDRSENVEPTKVNQNTETKSIQPSTQCTNVRGISVIQVQKTEKSQQIVEATKTETVEEPKLDGIQVAQQANVGFTPVIQTQRAQNANLDEIPIVIQDQKTEVNNTN